MNKQNLNAYTVIERDKAKSFWQRIGTAFPNKDGGFTLLLNALPIDGRVVLRPKNEDEGAQG